MKVQSTEELVTSSTNVGLHLNNNTNLSFYFPFSLIDFDKYNDN